MSVYYILSVTMITLRNMQKLPQREVIFAAAAVLMTALVILLTPLRYSLLVEPRIHDVDPADIYARVSAKPDDYLFIDVRPLVDYGKIHSKDAINIPIASLYDKWRELPRSRKQIVLICGGGRLSGVAFFFLQHFGFTNISRVSGGLENWVSKGLPVVLQESPEPLP